MLGKLIKHEFRATRRAMLPTLGILLLLSLLSTLSFRLLVMSGGESALFGILSVLFSFIYIFGILAAWILTFVTILLRFYRSMLGNEAYLTHTLPTSLHSLLISRLIVPLVWFLALFLMTAAFLVLFVVNMISLTEPELRSVDWTEIRTVLIGMGFTGERLWRMGLSFFFTIVIGAMGSCLEVYAAMSFGHMFSNNKVLYSVLAFVGLRLFFQLFSTVLMAVTGVMARTTFGTASVMIGGLNSISPALDAMISTVSFSLIFALAQSVVLYVITYFCQKKKLNLS